MGDRFFDYSSGSYISETSRDSAMSDDGHLMSRQSDDSYLDLNDGSLHFTSSSSSSRYDDDED